MTYALPFAQGAVVELGGGTAPMFHPNVDVRAAENVDLVVDFNAPLPFRDGSAPNLFSKYAAEHVSWRNIPQLWSECFRILAPGGTMVLVLPNLLEQARRAVEYGDSGRWHDENGVPCMIFGDLDYPENGHKVGWSPAAICAELRQAGFESVMVLPFGAVGTDMIVECRKGG